MENKKEYSYKEMENLAYLAADLLEKLYIDTRDSGAFCDFEDSRDRVEFLIRKAVEFNIQLKGQNEDEGGYNYIEELEKFEKEILEELKNTIRENKLVDLRNIVKLKGNIIQFDGRFKYDTIDFADTEDERLCSGTYLHGIYLGEDNKLRFENYWEGFSTDKENTIPNYEIDRITDYVKKYKNPKEYIPLTNKQKELVNKFRNILKEMKETNISIIQEDNKNLFAINNKYAEELTTSKSDANNDNEIYQNISYEMLEPLANNLVSVYKNSNEYILIKFKQTPTDGEAE